MAKAEHLEVLSRGVEAWNRWREENPGVVPDLREAPLGKKILDGIRLEKANLKHAQLKETSLRGAHLEEANLGYAYLRRADLTGAFLSGCTLFGANLRRAVLRDAQLPGARLRRIDLSYVDLRGADLTRAVLEYARLVDVQVEGAIFTECQVYGMSAWNLEGTPRDQSKLRISRLPAKGMPPEPRITVDDLAVAQFIHMLLNHSKLRSVFDAMTERGVLLLGRFGDGGVEVLRKLADRLRELGYLPILFDFDRPRDRNYTETVKTLVGLSRFVIVDLSGPSVPMELHATLPHFKIPFVPILEKGRHPFSMFVDLMEYEEMLKPIVEFASVDDLLKDLPEKIVAPAEERHRQRRELLQKFFAR
jgi:hypothetical protein